MTTITKKLLLFFVLTAASYLLNTVHMSLYYGVHFLFGSIPLVMLLRKVGVWPAFLGAIISQSYTLFLWNHPYALIIFSLEILFLGLFFKKKLTNIILRDALFWLMVGMPLVFLFYGEILKFGVEGTSLVALKDMMNGLVNVWCAEFLLFIFSYLFRLWKKEVQAFYTMREVLSYLSSGVLLVLSFTLVMLIGYYEQTKDRSQLLLKTQEKMSEATRYYETWTEEKLSEHQFWFERLSQSGNDLNDIQSQVQQLTLSGTAIGFELIDQLGEESNLLQYDIVRGEPQLFIHSPLDLEETNAISVETSFSLSDVERYVLTPLSANEMNISLISQENEVLFTNLPNVNKGDTYQERDNVTVLENLRDGDVVVHKNDLPVMQQWKQSTYTIESDPMNQTGATFVVATAFGPFIDYQLMNEVLGVILLVLVITLIVGEIISNQLLNKFESLSNVTTEVVSELPEMKKKIEFPKSMMFEFETLSHNFQILIKEWKEKYRASQKVNEELQEKKKLLEHSQQKMEYMAHYDDLTELPNRRQFNKRLNQLIHEETRFGLLFIDLDRFKYINDNYGHDVGDQVLMQVAGRLEEAVERGESFRLSGDEFTVIISPLEEKREMEFVSQLIRKQFEAPFLIDGTPISSNLSIGLSIYPDDANNKNALIKCADDEMYQSKNQRKNKLSW